MAYERVKPTSMWQEEGPSPLANAGGPLTIKTRNNNSSCGTRAVQEFMQCRTITRTVTTVRVLEILRDHQLHPHHNPLDAHLFPDERPLRKQFCKLLRHQCQASYLPSTGKHKHTHTHTQSPQCSADGIQNTLFGKQSIATVHSWPII